jgi:hypothetical protein
MVYPDYCIQLYCMIYMNAGVIGLGHNEFERALAKKQIRRPLVNQRTQAAALTTAGKFVICADSEVTCRWTDALIGYDFHIVKVCDTIEEARALAASSGYVFLFHLELPLWLSLPRLMQTICLPGPKRPAIPSPLPRKSNSGPPWHWRSINQPMRT